MYLIKEENVYLEQYYLKRCLDIKMRLLQRINEFYKQDTYLHN